MVYNYCYNALKALYKLNGFFRILNQKYFLKQVVVEEKRDLSASTFDLEKHIDAFKKTIE